MKLHFERGEAIHRQTRQLPAEFYNKLHLLFVRTDQKNLFIPIRPMQYLAAIDNEEVVFVDGMRPRNIMLSWSDFQVQQRTGLNDPVSFECVCYEPEGLAIVQQLQVEFYKALAVFESKQPAVSGGGSVTPLKPE